MTSGNCMKYQGLNSYSMIYNTTIQLTVFYLLGTQHLLGMWDSKVLWYRDVYIDNVKNSHETHNYRKENVLGRNYVMWPLYRSCYPKEQQQQSNLVERV